VALWFCVQHLFGAILKPKPDIHAKLDARFFVLFFCCLVQARTKY
jgi:hypothetical protein